MKSLALALLLAAAPVLAAVPFEAADLYKLAMVTGPAMSPDGSRVLFNVARFDIQTDMRTGEYWLATISGNRVEKHLLIPAGAKASGASWSPDGSRVAYVAPWLGKPQLWVMNVADGVGHPVTSGKLAPQDIAWSPDGNRIAFVARVEAPPVKLPGMTEKPDGATWAEAPKIIDSFRYRADGEGYGVPGADHLFVVPAGGGAPVQLTPRGSAGVESKLTTKTAALDDADIDQVSGRFDWTPDGQRLIYSARTRPGAELLPVESDLYSVAATGGQPQRLTDLEGSEDQPIVSPDGRNIAWIGKKAGTSFYIQDRLWVMPVQGGPARELTQALDRPVISAKWAADGKGIYAFYNDAGLTRVALLPVSGGPPKIVVNAIGGTRLYLPSAGGDWSEGKGVFAYTTVEADRPAGLGIQKGGKQIAHIDFNSEWRAGKSIGKLEHVSWKSSKDGLPIEGWVQYPPNFDAARKYPIALEIHGGPNTDYGPYFSITHQIYAANGYIVLFANPRGSIGYGEKFGNAIDKAYPGDDHDDLMSGVDEMLKRPYVDARNQFIGGGSGGGVLTTNAIAQTDRFRAAAALRPVTDWTVQALTSDLVAVTMKNWVPGTPWDNHDDYWRRSTLSMVGKVKTPTILIDGEADWRTPIGQSEAYYQALKWRGIPTRMVRLPEAGHGMGRPSQWLQTNLAVVDWYGRYLVK